MGRENKQLETHWDILCKVVMTRVIGSHSFAGCLFIGSPIYFFRQQILIELTLCSGWCQGGGFKDTEDNIISAFDTPRKLGRQTLTQGNRQDGAGCPIQVSGKGYLPGSRTEPCPTGAPSCRGPHCSPHSIRE